ncbi:MAG: hypothetical protein KKD38_03700 [Candidatus Delongbacteria bacterium]|nr:hypothetical protein [Candidatus Delongbacteria bacterium]MCG2760138.1 hypothetical protein [Candidatus Delongbacteria bacterium]
MDELNIPKLKKEVEIAFKDGGVIKISKMTLFLNHFSAHHSGEETVLEILNDKSQFIPAMISNGNKEFAILNIDSIIYVSEFEQVKMDLKKEDIHIQFITGEKMEFMIHEELPGNRSRAIDFLNSGRTFLTFLKDNRKIYINKNKINKVEVI